MTAGVCGGWLALAVVLLVLCADALRAGEGGNAQAAMPIADGPFRPDWESLKRHKCPEWFRDAKFGI